MSLTGALVRLRPVSAEDSAEWLRWLNDPEILGLMDMVQPVTAEQHEKFLRYAIAENQNARWFAIERDGRFIGKVWLWDINWRHQRAEVRVLVGERESWGSGAGSDALALISRYAFETLGLHKLYAFVHERNQRSKRAFLKVGFVEEAILREEATWEGSFQDVSRLALIAGKPDQGRRERISAE